MEEKRIWEKYWTAREVIVAYLQRKGPMIVTEIAPPLFKLDEAVVKAYEMLERMETIKNLDYVSNGPYRFPNFASSLYITPWTFK